MEEAGEYYVNEADGLSNEHPAMPSSYANDDEQNSSAVDQDSFDDLPTSLIVTSIHSEVFVNEDLKAEMESLFREFSEDVTFQWLKSFRRLRVNYVDAVSAGEFEMSKSSYFNALTRMSFKLTLGYSFTSLKSMNRLSTATSPSQLLQYQTKISSLQLPQNSSSSLHPAVLPQAGNRLKSASQS